MMKIKTLGLLVIVYCAIIQTNCSPLDSREDATDGEETDREFEEAFEEAYNNEVARVFQEENDEVRHLEEEVRELQDEQSPYNEREEDFTGEVTDRELESAFNEAIKDELVRDFEEENGEEARTFDDEEDRAFQDQPSAYNAQEYEATGEETDREFENAFDQAVKEEISRNFEEENMDEDRDYEMDDEMDLREDERPEDERPEDERQISADFDVTPPEEEEERQVVQGKPRSTQPLRLSKLIIRPVLTKRCQGTMKFSQSHCAKYLACGKNMFRGAVRTCESGQLFDAVLKRCRDSVKVDCKIY